MILRRFGLGVALVLAVMAFAQLSLGVPVFSGPSPADRVWWDLLGADWLVAFGCAGITVLALLGLRRWRRR